MVTVAALAIVFLMIFMVLIAQRQLLPGIVIVFSFILFVLWLAGLIETSIQFLGSGGGVNGNCNTYVLGESFSGISINTLAWLETKSLCRLSDLQSSSQSSETLADVFLQAKAGKQPSRFKLLQLCSFYG